ncbi:MAG: DUF2480 family protein [Cytophagales bacterium]|nr:DUF2480 family protein [Cytophagales bacterium]
MSASEPIVNQVAKSPLMSIDLDEYLHKGDLVDFDLKDRLFQGLILREKDFREFIKFHDWGQYEGKNVRLFCSADAVIPIWAYMLLMTKLTDANLVIEGSEDDMEKGLILQAISKMMEEDFTEAKVVIKGCGHFRNNEFAYTELTKALIPHVASLMYGEPCSTVPVYKKPKG